MLQRAGEDILLACPTTTHWTLELIAAGDGASRWTIAIDAPSIISSGATRVAIEVANRVHVFDRRDGSPACVHADAHLVERTTIIVVEHRAGRRGSLELVDLDDPARSITLSAATIATTKFRDTTYVARDAADGLEIAALRGHGSALARPGSFVTWLAGDDAAVVALIRTRDGPCEATVFDVVHARVVSFAVGACTADELLIGIDDATIAVVQRGASVALLCDRATGTRRDVALGAPEPIQLYAWAPGVSGWYATSSRGLVCVAWHATDCATAPIPRLLTR
jgi:hypothetical protein